LSPQARRRSRAGDDGAEAQASHLRDHDERLGANHRLDLPLARADEPQQGELASSLGGLARSPGGTFGGLRVLENAVKV
jgi:hypothetical protein